MDPRLRNQNQAAAQATQRQSQQAQHSAYNQADQGRASSAAMQASHIESQSRSQQHHHHQVHQKSGSQSQQRASKQHQSRPSGPPKRNKQFQEPESDCFHPRYELSFLHPQVPVEPKLFNYRLNTDDAASKYEYSCVELNQTHQIYVDFNMGMRVDLVDKERYQVDTSLQKQMLLGSSTSATQVKNEQEVTDKVLEELKRKLLSSRDKFILSNKDTLPDFEPQKKAPEPAIFKQSSIVSDVDPVKREEVVQAGNKQQETQVLTGQNDKKSLAIQQIQETFERAKRIKVGCSKLDERGRPIKNLTAVSVKDILPMHHAELLKLSMVVNDDDLEKITMEMGERNNGHLLHTIKDTNGDLRQSFYSLQAQEEIPDAVKEMIVGRKRTAVEAGFKNKTALKDCANAIQVQHVRDYAFTEMKGGSKGEAADYLLYDTGSKLQFVPISSRIKLNKTRKTNANAYETEQQTKNEISHIVMASRAYSNDETRELGRMFVAQGDNQYKMLGSIAAFKSKDDVQETDRKVADVLKEMFRHHLPKVELDEMDAQMAEAAGEDEDDKDLFGVDENDSDQAKEPKIENEMGSEAALKEEQLENDKIAADDSEDDIW